MTTGSLAQQTKDLLNRYNIRLNKSLGQNLLLDTAALERIISASGISKDDNVIEIGTGTGILTKELARYAKHVTTFEIYKKILEPAKD